VTEEEVEVAVGGDKRTDREKLIEELHAERASNVKAAAQAAQEAEAEEWLAKKREAEEAGDVAPSTSGFAQPPAEDDEAVSE